MDGDNKELSEEVVVEEKNLGEILSEAFHHDNANVPLLPPLPLQPHTWREIRLFLSSSFIDTHAERDALIKNIIPNLNREFATRFIRIVALDLRWGVLKVKDITLDEIPLLGK